MPRDLKQDYLEEKKDIWSAMSRFVWIVVFFLIATLAILWILPEQRKRQALEADVLRLQIQIKQQEATIESMREDLRLIREDPGYFEMIARDKLRLGKTGEYIIRLNRGEESGSGPQATGTPPPPDSSANPSTQLPP